MVHKLFLCLCLASLVTRGLAMNWKRNHHRVLTLMAAINRVNECAACQQSCNCTCVYQTCDNYSICEPGGRCYNLRRFFELLCGRLIKYL